MFHLYDKNGYLVEKEEDNLKVARHLMDFKVEDSEAGQPREGKTDMGSTKVTAEVEPLWKSIPVRSHSKSRFRRVTSQQAEPSTARFRVLWERVAPACGLPDDPFRAVQDDIWDAHANYERTKSLLRRGCVSMGSSEAKDLLQEIKALKEKIQLRAEKEQLEIRVT